VQHYSICSHATFGNTVLLRRVMDREFSFCSLLLKVFTKVFTSEFTTSIAMGDFIVAPLF
jgi:hypothetical protein